MLSHPMDCLSCFLPLCPYLVMSYLYSHLCASPVLRLDCCVSTARLNELSSTLMMLLNALLELSASLCAFLDNSVTEYRTKQNKLSGVFPSFCFPFLSFFIMNDPAVLILLLEQGDRSLEDHTNDFVFLANLTHYPDNCLCSFYYAGPHHTRAVVRGWSSRASPSSSRGRWCPASHIWPWTSQPHSGPRAQSSTTPQCGAAWAHRRRRARACRGHHRHQERQSWRSPWAPSVWPGARATVDTAVEITGAMESPAHGATAGGEHKLDLGDLIDFHSEIPVLQSSPELLTWENIPPNLPLPPPLIDLFPSATLWLLDPVSLSAHPQLTVCGVGSPRVCPSPAPLASSLEDPSTLLPASEAQTPPQFCDPVAPQWLPASSRRLIHPGSSCFLPGSSLRRPHPGLCWSSSSLNTSVTHVF